MPVMRCECEYCSEEFNNTWDCEEHEKHCISNPYSKESKIVDQMENDGIGYFDVLRIAEQMKSQGIGYTDVFTAKKNDQIRLRKWIDAVKPVRAEVQP